MSRGPASGIPAGGPDRGGPRRGYSWPPFEPGNLAALKHGARSPRVLQPIADRLAAGLAELAPWTSAASFRGAAASWAWAEAQAVVLRAYLDEHGLVDDDGQPRPAGGMLERVEGRLAGLRAQLGLTPLALALLFSNKCSSRRGAEWGRTVPSAGPRPFREVEGLFTVLMCASYQTARRSKPLELLADHDPGQPWLHWGCALCEYRAIVPEALEVHTALEHPGWVARYEFVRPYPNQQLRVVYRQVEDSAG